MHEVMQPYSAVMIATNKNVMRCTANAMTVTLTGVAAAAAATENKTSALSRTRQSLLAPAQQ